MSTIFLFFKTNNFFQTCQILSHNCPLDLNSNEQEPFWAFELPYLCGRDTMCVWKRERVCVCCVCVCVCVCVCCVCVKERDYGFRMGICGVNDSFEKMMDFRVFPSFVAPESTHAASETNSHWKLRFLLTEPNQGGNSQNFLRKFVRFFLTLGLKILRL